MPMIKPESVDELERLARAFAGSKDYVDCLRLMQLILAEPELVPSLTKSRRALESLTGEFASWAVRDYPISGRNMLQVLVDNGWITKEDVDRILAEESELFELEVLGQDMAGLQ